MFSPINVDIKWLGGKEFEVRYYEEYDDEDYHLIRKLILPKDNVNVDKWSIEGMGRNKFTFGMVEPAVVQIWTGLIFETPPGWCLHIRSPINFPRTSIQVMEGILETDFMQQDIWVNTVFTQENEWVEFRKDIPLAQFIPIKRESFSENWTVSSETVNRNTPEANRVFEYWLNFNEKKFNGNGKQALLPDMSRTKDSTTFFRERIRCLGNNTEPITQEPKTCPFHKSKDSTAVFCINDKPKYKKMLLNAVSMLRKYSNIPIKLIYVSRETFPELEQYNVKVINKNNYDDYFSLNKYYLSELEEDSILYLDCDIFINGDISCFFDSYKTSFTAVESKWAYQKGWKDDFLPNKHKPVNSGIQLFHNGYHREMFSKLPETIERLKENSPIANWCKEYHNGCLKEEIACSMILSESNVSYDYFKSKDCYNIERISDVSRVHESIIFHSYNLQYDIVKRFLSRKRKVLWKSKQIG